MGDKLQGQFSVTTRDVGMDRVIGIVWFLFSLLISNSNDVITKYVSDSIDPLITVFFRTFFGTLSLVPFIFIYGIKAFEPHNYLVHVLRGFLLFMAMYMWCFGIGMVQVSTATTISFVIPFIILVMGPIFLKETVTKQLWLATILGFMGTMLVLRPESSSEFVSYGAMVMLFSTFLFATLDIINKRIISKDSTLVMLFYSSLFSCIFCYVTSCLTIDFVMPDMHQLMLLAVLGINSNLILFCILKAFALVSVTSLSPYRYFELVISICSGFIIFSEVPKMTTLTGALLIVFSSLYAMKLSQKA